MPNNVRIVAETLPRDEHAFRCWMHQHPTIVLQAAGVTEGFRVLDYGCNRGGFTLPAAECVGASGQVYTADVNTTALDQLQHKATGALRAVIETLWIEDKPDAPELPHDCAHPLKRKVPGTVA